MELENVDYDYEDFREATRLELEGQAKRSLEFMRWDNATTPADVFEKLLRLEHRTHQANIIRFMLHVLKNYADANSDLRNERAVEICKLIRDLDKKENLHVPYI